MLLGAWRWRCTAVPEEGRSVLFNQMLAWGLSMAIVGAVMCYFLF